MTNNLSSYCGLVDAKIRASDKDLPVHKAQFQEIGEQLLQNLRLSEPCAMFYNAMAILMICCQI